MPDPNAKHVFSILVNENAGMLMSYLKSLVWKHDAAEDIFQETMLVAWRKIDQCDLDRPFGPWLRGIATKTTQTGLTSGFTGHLYTRALAHQHSGFVLLSSRSGV